MINFFPILYKDELLFSAISRYKQMCGIISNQALERELFNKIRQKLVFFPIHLDALISNLPPNSKITVEEIIKFHSMAPFYTSFLSSEKTKEIYSAMTKGNKSNVERIAGIGGSRVKSGDRLRYCPLCFKYDLNENGISYWRRLHQIPGVLYCPKHKVLLKDSKVIITDYWSEYYCADEDTCNSKLKDDNFPARIRELNMRYIENVCDLLYGNTKRKELSFIISFYIDKLRERGLASQGGTIYMEKLVENFLHFYPLDYLELMQSEVNTEQEANWLRIFVRYNNKNRSPLRHLLFLQFLEIDVVEFFNTKKVIGKQTTDKKRTPLYKIEEKRNEWLKLINDNPHANRSELKRIGKGLHTWIYKYDREWYNQVTPRSKTRKKRADVIDWEKRDEECLELAKNAVGELYQTEGKPKRISPLNIRKIIGVKRWFNHQKLVKTRQFIKEITEDIDSYRIRKIEWAIKEMKKDGELLTAYKIQRKVGFDGGDTHIKELIMKVLSKYERFEN
ncbi:TnsD family Tn7-like transposition protein [Neobacillus citreus]|uniref:TniQ family protein n=1 Tax=Neobacillus citreus TaxID=2833578 RepID=A0A942T7V2_9BACI|nr:TnsD family Tn7-like transposition protein [Neobacillus citreus]MCH6265105.1 TnsD family transposase [Neobacillus citreus]